MATSLDNLWIYKLAEDLGVKGILNQNVASEIAEQYKALIATAYPRFVKLNHVNEKTSDQKLKP